MKTVMACVANIFSMILLVLSVFMIKYFAKGLAEKLYLTHSSLTKTNMIVGIVVMSIIGLISLAVLTIYTISYLKKRNAK